MMLDVSDLGWHIQSCTEMKYMQLSSNGKVIENLGLPCDGLIGLEPGLLCVVNTSAIREPFINEVIEESGSCST